MADTNSNILFIGSALAAILVPTSSYIYMQGQNNQISKQLVDVSQTLNSSVKELSVEMNLLNTRVKSESIRADYNEERIKRLEADAKDISKELSFLTGIKGPR
jgi:hypothetical protein